MRVDDSLLERFEKAVDMPAYLSSRGYIASVLEPDRDHIAMTGPRGDVLRLHKDPERGDWTYANAAAPADRGSLSSLLERHEGRDRKAALEVLIACAQERRRDVAEASRIARSWRRSPTICGRRRPPTSAPRSAGAKRARCWSASASRQPPSTPGASAPYGPRTMSRG